VEGKGAPRARFLAPPEVVLILLCSGAGWKPALHRRRLRWRGKARWDAGGQPWCRLKACATPRS